MKKILIIEDDLAYASLLHTLLRDHGYEVYEANDGKKGLDLAKLHRPDLILLDIRIPIMDGITVLEELRKDPYGKNVKVIFLTNLQPEDEIVQKVLEHNPSYYLVKSDIQLGELREKIDKLVSDAHKNG